MIRSHKPNIRAASWSNRKAVFTSLCALLAVGHQLLAFSARGWFIGRLPFSTVSLSSFGAVAPSCSRRALLPELASVSISLLHFGQMVCVTSLS